MDETWGSGHDLVQRDKNLPNVIAVSSKIDREIVRNTVIAAKPPIGSRIGPRTKWTEMELLLNEFGKEKRFFPVRELMSRASNAIQCMKPCFMMSPLSACKIFSCKQAKL